MAADKTGGVGLKAKKSRGDLSSTLLFLIGKSS